MKWNVFSFRRLRQPVRRKPITRYNLALEQLETRFAPSVNVLTFHNDIASTGLNANETQLTPANVKVGSFGKLFTTTVDGQVYAEPLIDTGITLTNGTNTKPGGTGVFDVVFVATEHDTLYAIDAGVAGGAVLWQRTFLDTTNPGGNINNTLGATKIATVASNDVSTNDISPEIGITGTPVIDSTTNTLYVVVKTKETISGATHFVQRLHAINIADGTDKVTPYLIGDTTSGNSNNTQIYVYGTGDGNVTDPYNGTGKQVVQFNAKREHQRGALNLVNNTLYVEWASHGDNGPYHGWVAEWDVSKLGTQGFVLKGVLNTSPNNGLSGIWQGSGRLAFEADGSAFYFETGNGSGGAPTLDANGFPTNANYNEALVKVVADTTTSPTNQNANGWGLKVADYFIPYNVSALDGADSDFGSGGPLLLPDSAGIPGHPHLMLAAGKEGKVYLIDRDNLGKFDPSNDHVINAVPNGSGHNTPAKLIGGSLSTAAYFNGNIYWTSGYSSTARQMTISSAGLVSIKSQTTTSFGSLPGSAVVSSSGTSNGIAWIMDRAGNIIHAYEATTFATELWNSGQAAGGADTLGAVVKFAVPTVANGEVYVGTSNSLVVYGLTPPANAAPNAPVLTATALSGTSINLTWTDPTQPPNTATGYLIEQSIDNITFNQITTAPAGATSLAIGGLSPSTKYYFRIRGFNGKGNSQYSNVANATTTNQSGATLDSSAGFADATSKLTLNGSTTINSTKLELTNGNANQAGSAFSTTAVDVTNFNSQFTFQLTAGSTTADGFTFTIQGSKPTALGSSGGGLGYGPDHTEGPAGIPTSVAIKFDLYNNQGEGVDSTGLYTNGSAPTNVGSIDLIGTGVDVHSGDIFQVTMGYDGTTLTVTILDTKTSKSATQSYAINIPNTVGGTTAYVGFTGGTGGSTATQDILTWTYAPSATQSPNAPSGLGAVPATATSVTLNWTDNSTNQTGFHLDRATDSGFTQNLITENLPATPNSFTDTATGLAPGSTFYYRLRAYNSAGDSGNSNMATVTIPLAPPKPTNQMVTDVTTNEIDISWQDNAGPETDSYSILRAINHGSFTLVASLPPTSRTPPSTYEWSDTNLTPGTFYEYHIEAVNTSGNNDFAGVNATTLTLAPTGVTASGSNNVINLSWTAPTGAATFNIYRGTTPGGEGTTPYARGVTATTFADTAVTAGTTYYYEVSAVNPNTGITPVIPSESALSSETSASTQTTGSLVLAISAGGPKAGSFVADTDFSGGTVSGGTTATISTSGVTNPPPQNVLQHGRYGNFTYTIPNLTPGATYTVRLDFVEYFFNVAAARAFNVAINGAQVLSNFDIWTAAGGKNKALAKSFTATASSAGVITISFTSLVNNALINGIEVYTTAPAAPTGLTAAAGSNKVSLSWTPVAGVTGYNVYRGATSGSETLLAAGTNVSSSSFTDSTAVNGTPYFYYVTALNGSSQSSKSSEVSATPQAVQILAISAGGSSNGSFVADTDFSGGNVSGGTQATINTNGIANPPPQSVLQHGRYGNFTYTIPNLTPGATYTVRLDFVEYFFNVAAARAFNVAINGAQVLSNFDIWTAAIGQNIALAKSFTAKASSAGIITISFTSLVNNAIVSGIELYF